MESLLKPGGQFQPPHQETIVWAKLRRSLSSAVWNVMGIGLGDLFETVWWNTTPLVGAAIKNNSNPIDEASEWNV